MHEFECNYSFGLIASIMLLTIITAYILLVRTSTTTAFHTISYSNSNARHDAWVANVHFTVIRLLKGQSHSIR